MLSSTSMIDFRLPANELSSINETMIPLTFLAPNGTLTFDPTNKDFFKFSGIEYVKFWNEDIGSDTSANIIN